MLPLHPLCHQQIECRLLITRLLNPGFTKGTGGEPVQWWNRLSGNGQEVRAGDEEKNGRILGTSIRHIYCYFCYCPEEAPVEAAFAICFSGRDGTMKCSVTPHSANCIVET